MPSSPENPDKTIPPRVPPPARNYTPVLGLFGDGDPRPIVSLPPDPADLPAGKPHPQPGPEVRFQLSVIVPARNEEANLPECLASLLAQDERIFALGTDWELIVVDDDSTDSSRRIADSLAQTHPGLRVLSAPPLSDLKAADALTGKNNACWAGAQVAAGKALLFTDADTIHEAGDLRRALHEAERNEVALLSYSPRQILHGLAQHTVMPLIFAELASVYPPAKVNDPAERIAAANGQFLLVERAVYFAAGGHRALGRAVLEDVELATRIKRAKNTIRLRYAPDALSTRMYHGFQDMVEGWTKNLAALFPHALQLALFRLLDLLLLLLPLLFLVIPYLESWKRLLILALWIRSVVRFYQRVARAHFPVLDTAISPLGLPLFIYLLVASWIRHRLLHTVRWKGREYRT